MRRKIVLSVLFATVVSASAGAATLPDAKDILASVRLQQAQQEIDLQGQLRENEKVVPFRLTQTGPVIRYTFRIPTRRCNCAWAKTIRGSRK